MSIDALTSLTTPDDLAPRLVASGTARAKFEKRDRGPRRELASRAAFHDLPRELVPVAWDLTSFAPELDEEDRHALVLLILACLLAQSEGSTRLALTGPAMRSAVVTLGGPRADADDVIARITRIIDDDAASAVVGRGEDAYTPLVRDGDHVYLQRLLYLERRVAAHLADRSSAPPTEEEVEAIARETAMRLSAEQAYAVAQAATAPLTIVSGGPGTGKTTIVVALIDALVRAGTPPDRIFLAAPTGKAANRLRESIEARAVETLPPEPRTLHRMLGFAPRTNTFRHHENDPLPADVVIVDEGSMIDLALMERLLGALEPTARLVLLGDADQLPSVEAGAVFRDLARAKDAVRLTQSFRIDERDPAGAAIAKFAAGVNEGRVESVEHGVRLVELTTDTALAPFLDEWFAETFADPNLRHLGERPYRFTEGSFETDDIADLEAVFAAHTTRRLLTVTREATQPTGARAVNDAMRRRFAIARGVFDDGTYQPGEPILMLENDYQRGLFNGDQGVVLPVGIDGDVVRPAAVFRTAAGFEAFPLVQVEGRIDRAYALTVHKAQGSETDHVALLLPAMDVPILSREIVYTAVTRARRSVTIAGHPELLERAVKRALRRDSGLEERLA